MPKRFWSFFFQDTFSLDRYFGCDIWSMVTFFCRRQIKILIVFCRWRIDLFSSSKIAFYIVYIRWIKSKHSKFMWIFVKIQVRTIYHVWISICKFSWFDGFYHNISRSDEKLLFFSLFSLKVKFDWQSKMMNLFNHSIKSVVIVFMTKI